MSRGRIRLGVSAGILSLLVDGLAGITLVHLLFKHLPPAEAGLWSLVTTAGALLLLLPYSLTPAISRTIAQSSACSATDGIGSLSQEVRGAVRSVQIMLMTIGAVIFLTYLLPVANYNNLTFAGSVAWLFYVLGLLLTYEAFGHIACLNGLGEVGWDKIIRIVTSSLGLFASWLLLRSGGGLLGLGGIFLAQSVILLAFAQRISRRRTFRTFGDGGTFHVPKSLLMEGGRLLLLAGAGYIVANAGTVVIERRFGLPDVARYTALLRVGTMLASASVLLPQMTYPYVAQAWAKGDHRRVRQLYLQGVGLALFLCIAGSLMVWLLADWLFPLWLGRNNYLGSGVLLWTLAYQVVYVHHVAHSTPVLAATGNAFVGPALLNALLVPGLVVWASRSFGVVGVPIGTFIGTLLPSIWVVVRCWRFIHQPQSTSCATTYIRA